MLEDPFTASKPYWKARRRQGWRTGENWVRVYLAAILVGSLLPTFVANKLFGVPVDTGSPFATLAVLAIFAGLGAFASLILVGLAHGFYLAVQAFKKPRTKPTPPMNLLE